MSTPQSGSVVATATEKPKPRDEPPKAPEQHWRHLRDLRELPVGVISPDGRNLDKECKLRPHVLKVDRLLSRWEAENPSGTEAEKVTIYLATIVALAGHKTMGGDGEAADRAVIRSLHFADAMYLLMRSVYENVEGLVTLPWKCPNCAERRQFKGDLGGMKVVCAKTVKELSGEYVLTTPIAISDGRETATGLKYRCPHWTAMESAYSTAHMGDVSVGMLHDSVYGTLGTTDARAPLEVELDEMMRKDVKAMKDAITEVMFGPTFLMEGKCPECKNDTPVPVPWLYDTFLD